MSSMLQDPSTGLLLPRQHVDEKVALKKVIDDIVDNAVMSNQHLKDTYYLTVHAKFDDLNPDKFVISPCVITRKLPPFISNQLVFWVNNQKGICELLWMVTRDERRKLKVEFNKTGVAYLQAKGAMPS